MHMRITITTSLILLQILLLLASLSSGFELGYYGSSKEGASLKSNSLEKDINDEKLVLDYDDGGANPKHEPKGGKKSGGGNGKNP